LSAEEFHPLVEIMNSLGSAEHFATFTGDYYHDFLTALAQGDAATLIIYAPEGQSSAWLMMTHAYGLATYYFAAATPQAKRELAPDALVWKMIQAARERKCHTLDLMGIGSEDAPTSIRSRRNLLPNRHRCGRTGKSRSTCFVTAWSCVSPNCMISWRAFEQ
jgi:hypothetical protein